MESKDSPLKKNEYITQARVPLKSKVILGPIEKYTWYGVFPWQMLTHLMIVGFTTICALQANSLNVELFDPQTVVFFYTFLSDNDLSDF